MPECFICRTKVDVDTAPRCSWCQTWYCDDHVPGQACICTRLECGRKFVRLGSGPCELASGIALDKDGYPVLKVGGGARRIIRLVLSEKVGRVLGRKELANHTCDVRLCIAKHHLYYGSHQENMDDMKRRGRSASGDRNARSRAYREKHRG